jgi:hypothetical protein
MSDSKHINPYEIVMYIDRVVIFKKEFVKEEITDENIFDEILDIIKKLFSREYLKTA